MRRHEPGPAFPSKETAALVAEGAVRRLELGERVSVTAIAAKRSSAQLGSGYRGRGNAIAR
jgi:hypothetical protein